MSSHDPSGTSAQAWIIALSLCTAIVASTGLVYVWAPLSLMSFLGWETAVFMCCTLSLMLAVVGTYGAIGSRLGRSSSTWCFHRFGIVSFYHAFTLFYLTLHTFIAQPLAWYEMKHHWDIVSWRFPAFQEMNETEALLRASDYYTSTVGTVGILSALLLVLTALSVGCTARTVNWKLVLANALSIANVLSAVVCCVLVGLGIFELHRQEFYGFQAQVPLQVFLNAFFWLGTTALGTYTTCSRGTRVSWCVYFWWLVATLIVVVACAAASIGYMQHQFRTIDEYPDEKLKQANMDAGLTVNAWTREDYKLVLVAHFSPLFTMFAFLAVSIAVVFTVSCYAMHRGPRAARKKYNAIQ